MSIGEVELVFAEILDFQNVHLATEGKSAATTYKSLVSASYAVNDSKLLVASGPPGKSSWIIVLNEDCCLRQ